MAKYDNIDVNGKDAFANKHGNVYERGKTVGRPSSNRFRTNQRQSGDVYARTDRQVYRDEQRGRDEETEGAGRRGACNARAWARYYREQGRIEKKEVTFA